MPSLFQDMRHFGLDARRAGLFFGLSFSAALFEGFGIAMFLPVMEYIEQGGGAEALAARSRTWDWLLRAFQALNLPLTFATLLSAVLLLMLLRVVMTYARTTYVVWLTQEVQHCTRTGLFRATIRGRHRLLDGASTGAMVNLSTTEAQRLGGFINALLQLAAVGVVIIGYLLVLLWISPAMTGVAMLVLGLGGSAAVYGIRQTQRLSRKTTSSNEAFSFLLVERIQAARLIKLSAAGEREIDRMEQASLQVRGFNFWLGKLNARVDLLLEPVVVAAGMVILYVAVSAFHMSLSEIGLFMLVLLRLLPLAKELLRSYQSVQATSGGQEAILRGLTRALEDAEGRGGDTAFRGLSQGILLEDVTFTYGGHAEPALDHVRLEIPAGRITALVGPSGAGKSTLADLLPRLRREQQGRILFDGVEADAYDLGSLRQGMAFVSQDASILNDTVRNNLLFVVSGASDEDLWQALEQARAADFVRALPQGLDTRLGERGAALSGGQRQRLSLARALLKKVSLLVLDEPTSALDSETEQDIQAVVRDMRGSGRCTMVIIAHRFSTIREADKIVVLEKGRVSEQGTHQELMASGAWYRMVSLMQGGEGEAREGEAR